VGGRQRIPRSEVLFYGLGLRYERLDRRINPRRGLYVETNLERGNKERVALEVQEDGEPVEEVRVLEQERLTAELRLFWPTFRRQVGVLGGEAHVLLSNEYDTSDLFRFGGATSLRGYNEEQFLGNAVARVFGEYRYQLDRTSYAFLFADLGYVERPEVEGQPSARAFHPGYGVGAQLGTDLGLMTISLASNPDDPTGVRAHLGLSIGL
jgi:outer membrane protein assembly factor BamA